MSPKRKPEAHKRKRRRWAKLSQLGTAEATIGTIAKGETTFILTFGQMALMDALLVILAQSGPASVDVSTWTISDSDIAQLSELVSEGKITNLRMIVDCSFPARQPIFERMLRDEIGDDAIRVIKTHAKFIVVRGPKLDVVVHASMNMNRNPRLENMEICEDESFAEFFTEIVDSIFAEVSPNANRSSMLAFDGVPQVQMFNEVEAPRIARSTLNEVGTTHTLRKL